MRVPVGPGCREAAGGRGWGQGGPKGRRQPSLEPQGMCVQNASFGWAVLAPIFQYFFPKDASQPALPFLAWCMGKAPYFDNGEDLGKCAPTCSAALSVLNTQSQTHECTYLQTRPDGSRHKCVPMGRHTSTHTYLPSIRPSGMNTRMCTPRDSQHPQTQVIPQAQAACPRAPLEGHETDGVPQAVCSPKAGVHQSQTAQSSWHGTGSHCVPGPGGQRGPISSLSPQPLPHWPRAWEPSHRLQRVRETPQETRFSMRSSWGTPG